MQPSKKSVAIAAVAALGLASAQAESPADANVAEAKGLIKEFATSLQGELKGAMEAGGPTEAISVCKERAPAIAAGLSEESGWEIGRTSLKLRNPERNAPDQWEQSVLEQFEARRATGEPASEIAHAEVVSANGTETFRFMKAIPTGQVCLACHGDALTAEVEAALDEQYPRDQARGFSVGDIRGAFSLSKPL